MKDKIIFTLKLNAALLGIASFALLAYVYYQVEFEGHVLTWNTPKLVLEAEFYASHLEEFLDTDQGKDGQCELIYKEVDKDTYLPVSAQARTPKKTQVAKR